jgi:hypothetical protein
MRRSWTSEKKLAVNLEYNFLEEGMDGVGYVPVVAGATVCFDLLKQSKTVLAERFIECPEHTLYPQ